MDFFFTICNYSLYLMIILFISIRFVVTFPLSFLILVIWDFSLFFLVSLAKCLSIVLIFSKIKCIIFLFSVSFIYALIFSFLQLVLHVVCSVFNSLLRWKFDDWYNIFLFFNIAIYHYKFSSKSFFGCIPQVFVCLFVYFGLLWVFVAVCGISLVTASGLYSSLRCTGFLSRWLLLLWSMGSRCAGFSRCSTWAQ